MLNKGTYRIFAVMHTYGKPQERQMGRFTVQNGQFFILEDYDGVLEEMLPEGPFSDIHKRALSSLFHSGYFKLVDEKEVNQGVHEDLIPDLDIGNTEPDSEAILSYDDQDPQMIEIFGDKMVRHGQVLPQEEVDKIMEDVNNGVAKLVYL
jgi:hypothetical protein